MVDPNVLRRVVATFVLTALLAGAAGIGPARADEQNPGVARISVLDGYGVVIQRADSNESVAAAINAPLMPGDYLSTDPSSRAEIQLDYADLLRVGPDTQIRFVNLDATDHVVQLAQGTVDLSVLRQTDANPEIDTPSIGIRSGADGRYVVAVTSDGTTQVTVRAGQAQILLPGGTQTVSPGTALYASGPASNPQISSGEPLPPDSFDAWNAQRDAMIVRAFTQNYAGQIVGSYDLYSSGRWIDYPQYGQVWTPNEPAGWAPYSAGSWVWQPYYGWTWVSSESWGWAPYHYGRWFYVAGTGWCWYPGPPATSPPVWQPALVVFIGFGAVSVGSGFGNIGWVPLAPNEPYHPWWGSGYNNTNVTNITNVTNVTNVTNITNVYRNAKITGGVTAVSTQHFNQGVFTHPIRVAPAQIHSAHLITSTVPIVPTTQNLRYTTRPVPAAAVARPPNPTLFHGFTATPPPVQTFTQERRQVTTVTQKVYPHTVIPGAVTPPPAARPGNAPRPIEPGVVTPRPVEPGTVVRPTPPSGLPRPAAPTVAPRPQTLHPSAPPQPASPWNRFATPSHPIAPGGQSRTAPPVYVPHTAAPAIVPRTAPPAYAPHTAAPAYVPRTAPPAYVPHTAAPAYVPRTAPPASVPRPAPPAYVPHTAVPMAPHTRPPAPQPQHPPQPHKPTPTPEK